MRIDDKYHPFLFSPSNKDIPSVHVTVLKLECLEEGEGEGEGGREGRRERDKERESGGMWL